MPDICSSPAIIEIGQKHILLEIAVPSAGGAPIKCFHLEVCNLQDNSTKAIKIPRNESDNSETMQYKLQNLSPNGYFMFRCRAESAVGMGKYSMWTGEIKLRTGTNISVAKSASKSVSTAASKVANQVRFVDSNPMHAKNNSVNIADPLVGTMAIDMIQHNKESDANDGNHSVISDISTYESLDGDQKEYFDDRNFQEQQAAQGQEIHLPPTSTFKDF